MKHFLRLVLVLLTAPSFAMGGDAPERVSYKSTSKDLESDAFSPTEFLRVIEIQQLLSYNDMEQDVRRAEKLPFDDKLLMYHFLGGWPHGERIAKNRVSYLNDVFLMAMDADNKDTIANERKTTMIYLRKFITDNDKTISPYFLALLFGGVGPMKDITDEEAQFIIEAFPKVDYLLLRKNLYVTLIVSNKMPACDKMSPEFDAALTKEMYAQTCDKDPGAAKPINGGNK
jgi:hypothetical protein